MDKGERYPARDQRHVEEALRRERGLGEDGSGFCDPADSAYLIALYERECLRKYRDGISGKEE